jgi:hypothetical protein
MLITSATTFGAFVATAVSPLGEVATFGLFTALLVMANYIFVISYFPVAVLCYHRKYEHTAGFCCCVGDRLIPPTPEPGQAAHQIHQQPVAPIAPVDPAASAAAAQAIAGGVQQPVVPVEATAIPSSGDPPTVKARRVETFYKEKMSKLINLFPANLSFTLGFLIFAAIMVIFAAKLSTTTKEDQLLPDDHKFQRLINMFNNDFSRGSDTPMKLNNIVWGIMGSDPVDRDGVGRFDVTELGTLKYDPSFDLAEPATQQFIYDLCVELETATELVAGEVVPMVRRGAGLEQEDGITREINCFIHTFRKWHADGPHAAEGFPIPKALFATRLQAWIDMRYNMSHSDTRPVRWLPHEKHDDMVFIENGRAKYAIIQVNTTVSRWAAAYDILKKAYDGWDQWLVKTNTRYTAATGDAGEIFFSSPEEQGTEGAWVFMDTQEMLVQGAVTGTVASASFAFLVLAISTFNPFVAFLAMVNVAGLIACILGMMQLMGWEMGVIESISITVLVGLSVDYVVHLANSYIETNPLTPHRKERVSNAFGEMGVTVFGGAITSLGASAMLFACYFQTFFKFGGFMFMTILASFLWSNFFFMSVLSLIGPNGSICSFAPFVERCFAPKTPVGKAAEGNPMGSGAP